MCQEETSDLTGMRMPRQPISCTHLYASQDQGRAWSMATRMSATPRASRRIRTAILIGLGLTESGSSLRPMPRLTQPLPRSQDLWSPSKCSRDLNTSRRLLRDRDNPGRVTSQMALAAQLTLRDLVASRPPSSGGSHRTPCRRGKRLSVHTRSRQRRW
jgi:hypothetical protein